MKIFHIVRPDEWPPDSDVYVHESLASEGFIHCSFEQQLPGVIDRYYKDDDRLVILEIDPHLLTSELVIEPSTGGEEYPHVYGPLNVDSCVGISHFDRNAKSE